MDKNIKNLQHNISMALRSVPHEKTFDGIYQDLVKVTQKISIIESKSPKKEKKIDVLFQNWKLQNGNIVNPNAQNSGIDALQAIDELIQKEEENLNNFKKRLDKSNEIDDDSQTLLG
jgi:ribosome-associated translation inhibitor RaiA